MGINKIPASNSGRYSQNLKLANIPPPSYPKPQNELPTIQSATPAKPTPEFNRTQKARTGALVDILA